MKLDINCSCLFFHSLRKFGLSGSLLFVRKKYVSLYLREMWPLLPNIEFGPSCASKPNPSPFRADTPSSCSPLIKPNGHRTSTCSHQRQVYHPQGSPFHLLTSSIRILPPTGTPWQTWGCVLNKPIILCMLDCVGWWLAESVGDEEPMWGVTKQEAPSVLGDDSKKKCQSAALGGSRDSFLFQLHDRPQEWQSLRSFWCSGYSRG